MICSALHVQQILRIHPKLLLLLFPFICCYAICKCCILAINYAWLGEHLQLHFFFILSLIQRERKVFNHLLALHCVWACFNFSCLLFPFFCDLFIWFRCLFIFAFCFGGNVTVYLAVKNLTVDQSLWFSGLQSNRKNHDVNANYHQIVTLCKHNKIVINTETSISSLKIILNCKAFWYRVFQQKNWFLFSVSMIYSNNFWTIHSACSLRFLFVCLLL